MTATAVTDKKEKSLSEMLIVISLVALLMMTFIFYFFKHQQQLIETGFASIASVFTARITAIRGQWFMEQQPEFVTVSGYKKHGENVFMRIPVNNSGWVDIEDKGLTCQKIWSFVMEAPLTYMNEPISAIRVEAKTGLEQRYCQYSLKNGVYFTYHSKTGMVSSINTSN